MKVAVDTEKLGIEGIIDIMDAVVKEYEAPPLPVRYSTALEVDRAHASGLQRGLAVGFVFGVLSVLAALFA